MTGELIKKEFTLNQVVLWEGLLTSLHEIRKFNVTLNQET
jgi:hypothetical protein